VTQSAALPSDVVDMVALIGEQPRLPIKAWALQLRKAAIDGEVDALRRLLYSVPAAAERSSVKASPEQIATALASALDGCPDNAFGPNTCGGFLLRVGAPRWAIGGQTWAPSPRKRVARFLKNTKGEGVRTPTECFVGGERFPITCQDTMLSRAISAHRDGNRLLGVVSDMLAAGAPVNEKDGAALRELVSSDILDDEGGVLAHLAAQGLDAGPVSSSIATRAGLIAETSLELLLSAGFDPTVDGSKALICAARWCEEPSGSVRLLLAAGCDPSAYAGAALIAAIASRQPGNVADLLRAGVRLDVTFAKASRALGEAFWVGSSKFGKPPFETVSRGEHINRSVAALQPEGLARYWRLDEIGAMIAAARTQRQLRAAPVSGQTNSQPAAAPAQTHAQTQAQTQATGALRL